MTHLFPTVLDAIVPTTPVEEIANASAAPLLASGLIVMAVAVTALLILRFFRKK